MRKYVFVVFAALSVTFSLVAQTEKPAVKPVDPSKPSMRSDSSPRQVEQKKVSEAELSLELS